MGRSKTNEGTDSKRLQGWLINTLAVLIDESLISLRVTSGIVTDANNNVSEDRKIGSDTLRSPTLGNCIDLHAQRIPTKPSLRCVGHNVSGRWPNDCVSPASLLSVVSFYSHFYRYLYLFILLYLGILVQHFVR